MGKLNPYLQRFKEVDVSQLCDSGAPIRIFSNSIKCMLPNTKLIGVAHTVNCHQDNLVLIQAIREAKPGEVLVVASNGAERALYGEILSTAAIQQGVVGIVSDGACRDVHILRKLGMPFFASAIHPGVVTKNKPGEHQVPITCGGISVSPGDWIIGDDDGVIAISPKDAEAALQGAEAIYIKEQATLKSLRSGKSFKQILDNFEEYYADVSQGKKSNLHWDVD